MLEPLLSGFHWLPDGSGVGDTTIVLVQVFREVVHVSLFKSLNKGMGEFDLRGIGSLRTRHVGTERLEVEFSGDAGAIQAPGGRIYTLRPCSCYPIVSGISEYQACCRDIQITRHASRMMQTPRGPR